MRISQKVLNITASSTLALDDKVKTLLSKGEDIINLCLGEPDFYETESVAIAAIEGIKSHFTHYTNPNGIYELRKKIAVKLKEENGLDYIPDQITVSVGAKHALYNALFSIINKNEEVLIIAPYWGSYIEQVKLVDGIPKIIETNEENGFKLKPYEFENNISANTKAIILNSPSNPAGVIYTRDELIEIGKVAERNNIIVISDEIYEKLVYEKDYISIAGLSEYLKMNTITINGFSKAFGMTGWRIGYTAAPLDIARVISAFQSQVTANINTVAQLAALEALDNFDKQNIFNLQKNRDLLYEKLSKIECISLKNKPEGAFYLLPNIEKLIGKSYKGNLIDSSEKLCELILNEAKVAVMPGSSFGVSNNIRISFAKKYNDIQIATNRLKDFFEKIDMGEK